ncbi:hypothetical protein [Paraburkholderia sp. HP33-1]|uniref:hypothetical protein n=1 Tax=Paraburkholderia sp. HP33-1 TaxID=2883243 RepID=UPI001F2CEBB9|nr:hypothetical protein [Paraburkholderia sp. HP33-1]
MGNADIGDVRFGHWHEFNFDDFLIAGIDPATGIAGDMLTSALVRSAPISSPTPVIPAGVRSC